MYLMEDTNLIPDEDIQKCPLLVNSSTAWSPPGWCISKRDPPGDPWCRTMNFPNQQGLQRVRELPHHRGCRAQNYTYTSPVQFPVILYVSEFAPSGFSISGPILKLLAMMYTIQTPNYPGLGHLPLINKINKKMYLPYQKVWRIKNSSFHVTNILQCIWWQNIYMHLAMEFQSSTAEFLTAVVIYVQRIIWWRRDVQGIVMPKA